MRIACTTLACPNWPLGRILSELKAAGYDAIDFRGLGAELDVWKLPEFGADAARTARRIARAGLEVSAFSSSARMFAPSAEERARHLDEVRQYARLCGIFGSRFIRVFGGPIGQTPPEQAFETAAAALDEMARTVGPALTVAVETHDDWIASDLLAQVMRRVSQPNLGVLWDLHHPFRFKGESPRQTYDNIGRWTVATHLKDSQPMADGQCRYCLPGEGDVPLAEMVRLLRQGGYDGDLTLEWEKRWHPELEEPEVALPAYARFMRDLAK